MPSRRKLGSGRLVGMPGFEPGTSCTPSRRATRLRYIPNGQVCSLRGPSSLRDGGLVAAALGRPRARKGFLGRRSLARPFAGAGGRSAESMSSSARRPSRTPSIRARVSLETAGATGSSNGSSSSCGDAALLVEAAPCAGDGEPLAEHQLLQPLHALEVGLDGRSAARRRRASCRGPGIPSPRTAAHTAAP